jgi:hypothetical protein
VFTTPKCYAEDMKQSVHDQKDEHLSVVMNVEMMPDLLAASQTSLVQNYELTVRNDELEVVNMCALRCEKASLQSEILKMEDKLKKS